MSTSIPNIPATAPISPAPRADPIWRTSQSAFDTIARTDAGRGLVWLDRAPANNTWLIAVQGDLARREGLATMADFAGAVRRGLIRLAASTEFVESPAALPAFEAAYGFSLPHDRIISLPGGDTAVTARAAAQGISGVNAGMVYGTDGALSALDLVVMGDPMGAQIVYEVAPVIRAAGLERDHGSAHAGAVFNRLDAATLRRLNAAYQWRASRRGGGRPIPVRDGLLHGEADDGYLAPRRGSGVSSRRSCSAARCAARASRLPVVARQPARDRGPGRRRSDRQNRHLVARERGRPSALLLIGRRRATAVAASS